MFVEALCSINSGQADKGDILDLCADEANALIKSGAAREVSEDGKPTAKLDSPREVVEKTAAEREEARANAGSTGEGDGSPEDEPEDEAETRKDEILEAMKAIYEGGEDLTQSGKPEVKAIEEIVGYDISAQERDDLMIGLAEEEEE